MESSPVLVVVTAEGCPACASFFSHVWPELESKIQSLNVQVLMVSSSQLNQFRSDLSSFVGWFPTLLMFSASSWNNTEEHLVGSIYGGYFDDNEKRPKITDFKLSVDSMFSWISSKANELVSETKKHAKSKKPSSNRVKYSFVEI
jgi:hypothetical protein